MPTYEFRCPGGHDFERFYRKISDATSELSCPTCGQMGTRQISAGGGLLFKGSGFYLTDYGKNAHREAAPAAASGEGSTSESKPSDSKPSDSKPSEGKSSESKPSDTGASAPKKEAAAPAATKPPPAPPAKGSGDS